MLARNSAAWGLGTRQALGIALVPLVGAAAVGASGAWFALFDAITRENSLLEWVQFACLVASAVLFGAVARATASRRRVAAAAAYGLAALACFFVAGEELSWGQSIFDWGTPETFAERNFQGETNLHNVDDAHALFLYGVMAIAFLGALGTIVGVRWADRVGPLGGLFLPPACLLPAFVVPFVYRATRLTIAPEDRLPEYAFQITELSEAAETALYYGFAVLAFLCWRRWQPRARDPW